jgi:hypothetical protein
MASGRSWRLAPDQGGAVRGTGAEVRDDPQRRGLLAAGDSLWAISARLRGI